MKNDYGLIFYGGTFDPVHKGHLNVIFRVLDIFRNSEIFIVPSKYPVHKNVNNVLDISHRVNMLNIALSGISRVYISDIEINRETNYTIDSLRYLSSKFKNKKISILLGSDSFLFIETWKNYLDILKFYNFIVYIRDDSHKILVDEKSKKLDCHPFIISDIVCDVSSTKIKNDIYEAIENYDFLTPNLISYIKNNKLYGFKG